MASYSFSSTTSSDCSFLNILLGPSSVWTLKRGAMSCHNFITTITTVALPQSSDSMVMSLSLRSFSAFWNLFCLSALPTLVNLYVTVCWGSCKIQTLPILVPWHNVQEGYRTFLVYVFVCLSVTTFFYRQSKLRTAILIFCVMA